MATTTIPATGAARSGLEASTIRAISWRLIPFLVLAYFFSYLDRVNLGFAALTMNAELKFSPTVFAWGAGIFFIGYFIFEVPSNLALEKFGASRWIARIMVTWGIISALMATSVARRVSTSCGSCSASPKPDSFPASSSISPIGIRPNIARAFSPPSRSPFRFPPSSARRRRGCCWASTA
jgi:MFS family permease